MKNYKLAILGGMGPKATSIFFERIIENTSAKKDQEHIDLVILNHATLPDRTYCIKNNKKNLFLEEVRKDFQLLECCGVSNIAIPCNTSHYFMEDLKKMTSINIINMVYETVKYIYEQYGQNINVGLLATDGTIESGVYHKYAKEFNINLVIPNKEKQRVVMSSIYSLKETGSLNYPTIDKIIEQMIDNGCQVVILACTELSSMTLNVNSNKIVDAMNILIAKSIELSKGEGK